MPRTDVPAAPTGAETIRVLLADDHALMRRALRQLLESQDGFDVVAEAGDLASLVDHVDRHRPRVLLLDLGMLDGSSSDLIRQLRERAPETRIVIVTRRRIRCSPNARSQQARAASS
jgi:DNA-binding NarL/FixJ family response regulator